MARLCTLLFHGGAAVCAPLHRGCRRGRRVLPLRGGLQRPADQLLPVRQRLCQKRRVVQLGHRPGQRVCQFLLVLPAGQSVLLAVHGRACAAHAVGHGAAALPENGRCGRRRVSLGAPLGAGRDLEHAGGLPVCVFRVQHLQHLFQPLSGRCGAVSVHVGRAGRRGHRR